jgi:UDPglucose 6-dehydrogenase
VTISSRLLAAFWLGTLGLGSNSYRQRVPHPIWSASGEHKRAFLSGVWRGDGSWSYVNGGPSVILEHGSASLELADGLLRLLGDIGIVASLRVGRTAKSTVDNYWIRISAADQVEQLLDFVAERDRGAILASTARQAKRIASTGFRRTGDSQTAWVRVVSVERRPFAGPVYSVEVPGSQTYVTTGGLITHNCFPKDVKALARMAETMGYHPELLDAVMEINLDQRTLVVEKLREVLGGLREQVIGVLGLSYKPNTDDVREAPSIDVINHLLQRGAQVRAYDPKAMPVLKAQMNSIQYCDDPYAVAQGADALLVVTEWEEFKQLDFDRVKREMRRPVVVDGRNMLDPKAMRDKGFVYRGVGRS